MGIASVVRAGLAQRMAVGAAFASVGAMYSEYKANAPCVNDLLALGGDVSPLAAAAEQITREGSAKVVRRIQRAKSDGRVPDLPSATKAAERGREHGAALAKVANEEDLSIGVHSAIAGDLTGAAAGDRTDESRDGAQRVNSWEAVRQRYQARAAGDEERPQQQHTRPSPDEPAHIGDPSATRSRVRRNAYGDEVID